MKTPRKRPDRKPPSPPDAPLPAPDLCPTCGMPTEAMAAEGRDRWCPECHQLFASLPDAEAARRRAAVASVLHTRTPEQLADWLAGVRTIYAEQGDVAGLEAHVEHAYQQIARLADGLKIEAPLLGTGELRLDGTRATALRLLGEAAHWCLRSNRPASSGGGVEEAVTHYIDLQYMAYLVKRTKRTLEGYKSKMPPPTIPGGHGRPAEWDWNVIRPWLETTFNRRFSEVPPWAPGWSRPRGT